MAPLAILYDRDVDRSPLEGRSVAVVGFGNQGAAQAQNLRDSGVRVIVGAREGNGALRARSMGFAVYEIAEATRRADVVSLLLPDDRMPEIFESQVRPHLGFGKSIALSHGFCLQYRLVVPPPDVDTYLMAPMGVGTQVREVFERGGGVPVLIAVHQDASGGCRALALAHAAACGGGRAGILESSVQSETETDLFGEQVVVVGGVSALVRAAYDTLVEAGYPEELAYFECIHQLKLLVDLIQARGVAGMHQAISSTAEFGSYTRGGVAIDEAARERMRDILGDIRSGRFAAEFVADVRAGSPRLKALREAGAAHPSEAVGERLRSAMKGSG